MTSQPRRATSGKLSRRQRRAQGAARTYESTSAAGEARTYSVPSRPSTTRRSYMVEPQPVDYTAEARSVRKDLLRLVLWAALLIVAMVALSLLPLPIG